MPFDCTRYGAEVQRILMLDGGGERLMPLAAGRCSSAEALRLLQGTTAQKLFAQAASPEGALGGLYLYFSCMDEAHSIAQDLNTGDGSFWHGILHRQEPDSGNAAYWFRRVGSHPVFPKLHETALLLSAERPEAGFRPGKLWDPLRFIDYCEAARAHPGSSDESLAREIQRAEWQLLFDHCARAARTAPATL